MPADYYRKLGTVELRFEWSCGPYITVHEKGFTGVEVINVWDSRTNKPTIPCTGPGLRQAADEWVETYGDQPTPLACMAALEHDVINHWRLIQKPNPRGGRVGRPRGISRSLRSF